ncbi:hypothetical protein RCL_jg26670.t1 [Rhizophagus clarus]|uniref:Transmembrane protein n=1 Tax=Rhizophagus clarus TaxID=94130 RepID=A0A8H3M0H9_9GLOM|nr:hypothetical protein RCL_jg26670.t1 [Rhizophagus clarus]
MKLNKIKDLNLIKWQQKKRHFLIAVIQIKRLFRSKLADKINYVTLLFFFCYDSFFIFTPIISCERKTRIIRKKSTLSLDINFTSVKLNGILE